MKKLVSPIMKLEYSVSTNPDRNPTKKLDSGIRIVTPEYLQKTIEQNSGR